MSEYDIALDYQVDWASFWSSDAGRAFFHSLGMAVSKQRKGKGEKQFNALVDNETDELQLVLMPIIHGECYYWSSAMLDIVKAASKSLPDSWTLMKSHIPSISGFFYFAKEIDGIQAIGWTVLTTDSNSPVAAIYLPNEETMPDFNAVALTMFMENPSFSRPIPARCTIIVGETLKDWKLDAVREAGELNADVKELGDSYESIRLFGAMVSFIQQRILVPSRWSVSRATRRRVQYARPETNPSVNVIKLRSIIHHTHKGDGEPVDWSCRWIVHGFWRDQWYPSISRHQPIWISTYIKGPDDKPLRNPGRLFAVVR